MVFAAMKPKRMTFQLATCDYQRVVIGDHHPVSMVENENYLKPTRDGSLLFFQDKIWGPILE
jgi:hypothetical protein